jgi:streptogramin lyase
MIALRYSRRAFGFALTSLLLASCAKTPQALFDYPQPPVASQTLESAGRLGALRYFRALPNGNYPGSNLIEGPDKNLWYANSARSGSGYSYSISTFTPSGTTTYPVPPLCGSCGPIEPTSLVSGPDGRVWFGTASSYVIGAMDTSGKVQYYNGPSPYCGPAACNIVVGVVLGKDVWFTAESLSASFGHQLFAGYIDTSTGATKSYATGAKHVSPSQIVMGSNGALWFGAGKYVASISPYGGVNSFLTYPPMKVGSIVSGPDGDLWFVSDGEGRVVGRMKTDGRMLNETTLKPGEIANQLALGPDNRIWITTNRDVVRMTSPRTYQSIGVPKRLHDCEPAGVSLAADGTLWFSSTSVGNGCSRGIGSVLLAKGTEQGHGGR